MNGAPALSDPPSKKPPTPSTKKTTTMDIISLVVFAGFSVIALYFGWKVGRQNGTYFWGIVQAIGAAIRSYLVRLIAYAQEYARRSR
jgi:hypothetical protein